MKPAFIVDADLLQALEGQQYIVFRPDGDIAEYFKLIQGELKKILPPGVKYPNTGHITLGGFSDSMAKLDESFRSWVADIKPLVVSVESIDSFPSPFKIIILKMQKDAQLRNTYDKLTASVSKNSVKTIGMERSSDNWIFHMSLAYCSELNNHDWQNVLDSLHELPNKSPRYLVNEAELVEYRTGEHASALKLGDK